LPEQSTEKFIQGLFANQVFEIGDKQSTVQFQVQQVEVLPPPEFTETMRFETMSPMCLSVKREDGSAEYISPEDTRAKNAILSGLLSRYESFYGKPFPSAFDFDLKYLNRFIVKK
jgi:CRISPR-associated endoribonuclease Cas6